MPSTNNAKPNRRVSSPASWASCSWPAKQSSNSAGPTREPASGLDISTTCLPAGALKRTLFLILYTASPVIHFLGYFIPFLGVFVLFLKAKIIQQDSKFHRLMFDQFMLYYKSVDPASVIKRTSGTVLLRLLGWFTDNSAWVFTGLTADNLSEFKNIFERNLKHVENAEIHSKEIQEVFQSRIDKDPIRKSLSVKPMPIREID